MKHITLVADVSELLKKERMSYLEVFEGNCTGRTMIWVCHRQDAPGNSPPLTDEELDVLDIIFQQFKPRKGKVYSYGVWKAKAAMALGAWRKRLPVCELCGLVYLKNEEVAQCAHPKPEAKLKPATA